MLHGTVQVYDEHVHDWILYPYSTFLKDLFYFREKNIRLYTHSSMFPNSNLLYIDIYFLNDTYFDIAIFILSKTLILN